MDIKIFLLDGPPAIFIIGGFVALVVIPTIALIALIWFFVKRMRKKKKEQAKTN